MKTLFVSTPLFHSLREFFSKITSIWFSWDVPPYACHDAVLREVQYKHSAQGIYPSVKVPIFPYRITPYNKLLSGCPTI